MSLKILKSWLLIKQWVFHKKYPRIVRANFSTSEGITVHYSYRVFDATLSNSGKPYMFKIIDNHGKLTQWLASAFNW